MKKLGLVVAAAVVVVAGAGGYAFVRSAGAAVVPGDFDKVLSLNAAPERYQRDRLAAAGNLIVGCDQKSEMAIAVVSLLVRSNVSPMDIDRSSRAICKLVTAGGMQASQAAAMFVVAYEMPSGMITLDNRLNFLTDADRAELGVLMERGDKAEAELFSRSLLLNRLGLPV